MSRRFLSSSLVIPAIFFVLHVGAILLYSPNSFLQISLGVSVPVKSGARGKITFNCGFQLNYALPSNVSELEPGAIVARHVRDLDLHETYAVIEDLLQRHGWGDGRDCLLRSICELAESPLDKAAGDIVEEAIHLILTPTQDTANSSDRIHWKLGEPYRRAELLGRSNGDCILAYPNCIESPLKYFTETVLTLSGEL